MLYYVLTGYQDFVPQCTNRSQENKGYEMFSEVMDRASDWVAQQRSVRFTNLQTVQAKIKKSNLTTLL